jgi:hypothetical protein
MVFLQRICHQYVPGPVASPINRWESQARYLYPIMRNVLLLLLLIIAPVIVLIGVLFKVQHFAYANILIGIGLVLEVACAVGFIVRSMAQRRQQQ